ncbi:T7SS effector LXG polymorphic toxin [uncultured Streptococcus sp.]|uniref:T7SS effector LXG polymorphic toxin n=1 Tax=uncultured Streptococcus sp. TaxID=83427 RepID=UPI00288C4FD9|nr:T7SS effector LXG polymorphic toxin [uncultured Streptococcus sp.]
MSYKIKFDDITSVQVESQKTMNAWEEAIANLNKAMSDFINNQNLQGQAISSMRNYLVEVHGTLLQTLVNLMNDYSTNLLLYKDGYYQIDSSNHAKLPGQVFTTLHSDLKSSRDNLKSEIELLNTTKDKISDLVSYSGSSHTSTVMNYNFLMNQVKNLDNSIIQYESNHASQDLVAFKELLSATKALIAEHAGKTRTVGTYQSGDFAKLQSVQRFAIAYQQASKQMESRVERVQAAQERDKARFEALAAEDRAKNGWKDLAIGVVTVAIGALAIWATMGAATPLVVGAGLTAGIGTAAYGASNAGEGIHNIQLGNAGDAHTKSYNLIRDTLFMGNDKLYHDVGNVFVTASAIMIPIGQTQSVVKGLTQFAIGEAGAYTAGQVAYHGTKLLGGSEEDAQTANFIGNIVGGYAVSSAASKFSLNQPVSPNRYSKIDFTQTDFDVELIRGRLKTDPDTAFFWSGRTDGIGGMDVAKKIAKNKGGVTLESTIDDTNIVMPEWDFNTPSSVTAWEEASNVYAEQVSGEIRAVVGSELRPGNIWENIELPRLKANPNVTKVTTIDPKTGVEKIIFER